MAKLDDNELTSNRGGASGDLKAAAALRFAKVVVTGRGTASVADLNAVKATGYSDTQVVEIILHVALNTLTNYVNKALATDIDFPIVGHHAS